MSEYISKEKKFDNLMAQELESVWGKLSAQPSLIKRDYNIVYKATLEKDNQDIIIKARKCDAEGMIDLEAKEKNLMKFVNFVGEHVPASNYVGGGVHTTTEI